MGVTKVCFLFLRSERDLKNTIPIKDHQEQKVCGTASPMFFKHTHSRKFYKKATAVAGSCAGMCGVSTPAHTRPCLSLVLHLLVEVMHPLVCVCVRERERE